MSAGGSYPGNRVLFFGKSKPHTWCTGNLVHGLRAAGKEVRWINPFRLSRWLGKGQARDRIFQLTRAFRPDLLFVFFRDLPLPILEELAPTIPTVLWVEEYLDPLPEDVRRRAALSAVVVLTNLSQVDAYRAAGARKVVFSLSGCGPTHYDRPFKPLENPPVDVVFIGGPGSQESNGQRPRFLARLARDFKVEIIGKKWDNLARLVPGVAIRPAVGPKGYYRACRRSAVVLGLNERNDLPLYFSNRIWLTLACGGFHLTHYVPRIEEIFQKGGHLDWFQDEEECVEMVRDYLQRGGDRRRIAGRGKELVVSRHTYRHRVEEILEALGARGGAPV